MSDCCSSSDSSKATSTGVCPKNGLEGKAVPKLTVEAILSAPARSRIQSDTFYICMDPNCSVVYFGEDGLFEISDLVVAAGYKEEISPQTVCYCFGHSVESIEEEIQAIGRSTVVESILTEIKAGNCECATKNPTGKCCFRDIAQAIKNAEANTKSH